MIVGDLFHVRILRKKYNLYSCFYWVGTSTRRGVIR